MKTIIILLFILPGIATLGLDNYGFIDYEKVTQSLPEFSIFQRELSERENELSDSLQSLIDEYEDGLLVYYKREQQLLGDPEARALEKKEKQLIDFKENIDKKLTKMKEDIRIALKNIVTQELKEFCLSNQIAWVSDGKEILYCAKCTDYTDTFINYLKNKSK